MSIVSTTEMREIVSVDPSNGEELGRVPLMSATDVLAAVKRARQAQPAWAQLSFRERAEHILRARELVLNHVDEIAALISRETGKPPAEAMAMEVVPTLDLMHYFAKTAKLLLRRRKIDIGQYELMGRSSYIVYKPVGVAGIISPWNFPWATPLDEAVMALMAVGLVTPNSFTACGSVRIGCCGRRSRRRTAGIVAASCWVSC